MKWRREYVIALMLSGLEDVHELGDGEAEMSKKSGYINFAPLGLLLQLESDNVGSFLKEVRKELLRMNGSQIPWSEIGRFEVAKIESRDELRFGGDGTCRHMTVFQIVCHSRDPLFVVDDRCLGESASEFRFEICHQRMWPTKFML